MTPCFLVAWRTGAISSHLEATHSPSRPEEPACRRRWMSTETLTQTQYEEREAFLNDLVALQREFTEILGAGGGMGFGPEPTDPSLSQEERTLQQHRRQVVSVYNSLNGSGVRQGSLYPPTQTHRAVVEAAREALREYRRQHLHL